MFQYAFALLLQLCLATLAFAAPLAQEVSASTASNSWQYGTGGGVIGFIVLVLDIIVLSTSAQLPCPSEHLPPTNECNSKLLNGMLTIQCLKQSRF